MHIQIMLSAPRCQRQEPIFGSKLLLKPGYNMSL